jgi:hypothetical protein
VLIKADRDGLRVFFHLGLRIHQRVMDIEGRSHFLLRRASSPLHGQEGLRSSDTSESRPPADRSCFRILRMEADTQRNSSCSTAERTKPHPAHSDSFPNQDNPSVWQFSESSTARSVKGAVSMTGSGNLDIVS